MDILLHKHFRVKTALFGFTAAILSLISLSLFPDTASANSLTVVNTNDSGSGSLRQAILDANSSPDLDTISFDIPISGNWCTITLLSALPVITGPVIIDGSTQTQNRGDTNPGWVGSGGTVGTDRIFFPKFDKPEIEINAGQNYWPLLIDGSASDVTIQGLAIFNAGSTQDQGAIQANGGTGTNRVIEDCLVGVRADGSDPGSERNTCGGILAGAGGGRQDSQLICRHCYVAYNAQGGIVGEPKDTSYPGDTTGSTITVEYCEVFSNGWNNCAQDGIDGNGLGNIIRYNLCYNNLSTSSDYAGGGGGLELGSYYDTIDSQSMVENNTFSGNQNHGIAIMKNPRHDILQKNIICGNGGPGILITTRGATTDRHLITLNSIYNNAGLGIDLTTINDYSNGDGVTFNDGLKDGAQANDGMDFPVITKAELYQGILHLEGYIGSAPGQSIFASSTVEFFISSYDGSTNPNPGVSNDSVPYHGEGRTYLGSLAADANGSFTGTLDVSGIAFADNFWLTATARDTESSTSEFSENIQVSILKPIVGGEIISSNKLWLIWPWLLMIAAIAVGGMWIMRKHRRS